LKRWNACNTPLTISGTKWFIITKTSKCKTSW